MIVFAHENVRLGVGVRFCATTGFSGFCMMVRIAWVCAQRTTLALDVGHGLAAVVARPTYKR